MAKRKNDTKYHEVLKQAAGYCYEKGNLAPEGYKVIKSVDNKDTGFHAEVLAKGNDVIVAYRGTDQLLGIDGKNDYAMARKNIPAQATDAIKVYDQVKQDYPNSDVTVTGHSLGGSLSQIVSSVRGCDAVTFNAYGTKDMFKDPASIKEDNIVNYVNEKDYITMCNAQNHIGETYSIEGTTDKDAHYLETMGSLEKRNIRTSQELKKSFEENLSVKTKIRNNIDKSKEVIVNTIESTKGYLKKDNKSNNKEGCVGSYSVSGYTRSDGTKIGDYTRSCGAKHTR